MSTTSLKLPEDVKEGVIEAARQQGVTPHAFMVDAIRTAAVAAGQRAAFVASAVAARKDTLAAGTGHAAADVHGYIRARAKGKAARRPAARTWRN